MPHKVLIVARIHAEHPKAAEFNRKLSQMLKERELTVEFLKAEAKRTYLTMSKVFRFECKDASGERYLPEPVKLSSPMRLVRKWTNKSDFDSVSKLYGVAADGADQEAVVCSVVYYRMNGLLLSLAGTGANVLKVNVPCSDSDWEYLTQGVVLPTMRAA